MGQQFLHSLRIVEAHTLIQLIYRVRVKVWVRVRIGVRVRVKACSSPRGSNKAFAGLVCAAAAEEFCAFEVLASLVPSLVFWFHAMSSPTRGFCVVLYGK